MKKTYFSPEFEFYRIIIKDDLLVTSGEDFVPDVEDEFGNDDPNW